MGADSSTCNKALHVFSRGLGDVEKGGGGGKARERDFHLRVILDKRSGAGLPDGAEERAPHASFA